MSSSISTKYFCLLNIGLIALSIENLIGEQNCWVAHWPVLI